MIQSTVLQNGAFL